jgi:predicted PurR-regulated permease PerM
LALSLAYYRTTAFFYTHTKKCKTSVTLLLTILVIIAFGAFFFSQASRFSESWPILVDKFTGMLNQTITWASGYFDINPQKIHEWITKTKGELINTSTAAIGQTLVTVGSGVVVLFLVPVYIFLILS